MAKTMLNRFEVEKMIMNELRSFAPCTNVQGVVVVQASDIEARIGASIAMSR
jgi:hypothetical protein